MPCYHTRQLGQEAGVPYRIAILKPVIPNAKHMTIPMPEWFVIPNPSTMSQS